MARGSKRDERRQRPVLRCPACGKRLDLENRDPGVGMLPAVVVLAGGLLSLYLVGIILVAAGIWLWFRAQRISCPSCGARIRL